MQRIALSKAKPGMVLAEPVLRPDGLTLVGAGLELTEPVIERINASGTKTVVVEGHPIAGGDGLGNLSVLASGLDMAFRRHADNAFMMTLYNMLRVYFARTIAEQHAREEEATRKRVQAMQEAAQAAQNVEAKNTDSGGKGV